MSITFATRIAEGPELNMATGNFRILSQLLQLESNEDDCGSINANILQERIVLGYKELNSQGEEWERSTTEWTGSQGAKIYEIGLYKEQLLSYLDRLKRVVDFAIQHNEEISWC